jgi:phenylpropionate dioxygenase-like ring-hydroxylating dioxygenase large terminal subunit
MATRAETSISDELLAADVRPHEGVVPTRIFIDDEIHQQELSRVFARSWLFVGHETEVPSKGDYVVRGMAQDGVIMARGEDLRVRVFLNQCRHRGMQVCRAELGNASHFRCPYHGWIYKNDGRLAGVPLARDVYGSNLDIKDIGLREPRVGTYRGLVFACWDDEAPSLDEYLGDARWYLDLLFGRTDAGLEVIGPPQRWVADMNWKLGADNFTGDGYHVWTLHRHAYEMGMLDPQAVRTGHVISTPAGHGIRIQNAPDDSPLPEYIGMPAELNPMLEHNLSDAQRAAIRKCTVVHGNVFPNLSFVYSFGPGDPDDPFGGFVNIRLWQPTAAGKSEIWSWFMVDQEASDAYKAFSRRAYVRTHGVSGTFDQDDLEVWTNITNVARGEIARDSTFNYVIGLGQEPDTTFPGPGDVFEADYSEANQRVFYAAWLERMLTPPTTTNGAPA